MRRWLWGTAIVLGAVVALSPLSAWARTRFTGTPPLYVRWGPAAEWPALGAALVLGAAVVAIASLRARWRIHPANLVPALIALALGFSAAAAATQGSGAIEDPIVREHPADYHADTRLVREAGVRGFIGEHPRLIARARSVHTVSHPPGPVVLLHALEERVGDPGARATVLAALGVLILVPAWAIARRMGGERAAAIAIALLAVSPALALYAFTSLDAVIATALAIPAAVLLHAFAGPSVRTRAAVAGGALLGLATFVTYAASFVMFFAVTLAVLSLPRREAVRGLAAAAAGGLAAIVALRVGAGFDLLASYRASFEGLTRFHTGRPWAYWIFGAPSAWLVFAGIPVAALAVRALVAERVRPLIALVVPLAIYYLLPERVTHLGPGELERTLLFAYPFAAAAAGRALSRAAPALVASLVALTAAQALTMEIVFNTFW